MRRMMKRIYGNVNNNAVTPLLLSYLLILLLTFLCCTIGFKKAFSIIEKNLIEENVHLMEQSTGYIDELFSNLNDGGLQLASSSSLRRLSQIENRRQEDYYGTIQNLLAEYRQAVIYREEWEGQIFVYVNGLNKIIYEDSVYFQEAFDVNLKKWNVSEEEWNKLCNGSEIIPYTHVQENGEIIFVFPARQSSQSTIRFGTVFFRMEKSEVLEKMAFLEKYSACSFFMIQDDQILISEDQLGCISELEESWLQTEGNYYLNGRLVFNIASERDKNRNYILVIPQQEAMLRLQELRSYIWILIFAVAVAGTAIAMFFSMRNGKQVNRLADMLEDSDIQAVPRNLSSINDKVSQMLQDQKKNQIALQKAFFHDLLKADFLSRAEMEYMAGRVNLQLQGDTYYAGAIRFFPQIDADGIDGQTVEEAKKLQILVKEWMEEKYVLPMWSYKKNTLVTMYVIEVKDEELLLEVMTDAVIWLREICRADAHWGVGTPCNDLMDFWKSAEEAVTALSYNEKGDSVCLYRNISYLDDSYYLPYTVEEHFRQGLRTGDYRSVESTIQIIREENVDRRTISRKQFLKLNHEIGDCLSEMFQKMDDKREYEDKLIQLSGLAAEESRTYEGYFTCLASLCHDICEYSASQKSRKRNKKMRNILDFMEENYADPEMDLGMVSEHCKLSEGYLSAIFKEEMDINFASYLEQLRIDKACQLLKEGELVAVIAEKTGYNSVQSFRRAFKRVKGIAPSEFRI